MEVLEDKIESRWIIADPSNITKFDIGGGPNNYLTYYKRKSSAQKELDEKVDWAKRTGFDSYSDEYKKIIASAEVIEVEMQTKIKFKKID
jgi:hypothetical protein